MLSMDMVRIQEAGCLCEKSRTLIIIMIMSSYRQTFIGQGHFFFLNFSKAKLLLKDCPCIPCAGFLWFFKKENYEFVIITLHETCK